MNRFFTLLLAASCLTAVGQVDFPWNPDTNDDGIVGAEDLLGLLSVYNGEWELPDPTLWATSTIQSLIALENELDSIEQFLQSEQLVLDSLSNSLDSLSELAFCTEQLSSWNTLKNDCFIYMSDGYNNGYGYHIPEDCFHVTVSVYYGCNCCSFSLPIRLPPQGMYYGQIIDITLLRQGGVICYSESISIERLLGGNWSEVSTLFDPTDNNTSQFNSNFFLAPTNRRFIWDGASWVLVSFPTYQVQATQAPE